MAPRGDTTGRNAWIDEQIRTLGQYFTPGANDRRQRQLLQSRWYRLFRTLAQRTAAGNQAIAAQNAHLQQQAQMALATSAAPAPQPPQVTQVQTTAGHAPIVEPESSDEETGPDPPHEDVDDSEEIGLNQTRSARHEANSEIQNVAQQSGAHDGVDGVEALHADSSHEQTPDIELNRPWINENGSNEDEPGAEQTQVGQPGAEETNADALEEEHPDGGQLGDSRRNEGQPHAQGNVIADGSRGQPHSLLDFEDVDQQYVDGYNQETSVAPAARPPTQRNSLPPANPLKRKAPMEWPVDPDASRPSVPGTQRFGQVEWRHLDHAPSLSCDHTWEGANLAKGGFGLVRVFVELDENRTIIDRMAVKDSYLDHRTHGMLFWWSGNASDAQTRKYLEVAIVSATHFYVLGSMSSR
jgi:hypothetical protein